MIFSGKYGIAQTQNNRHISGTVKNKAGKALEYVLLNLYKYDHQDSIKKQALFTDLDGKYLFSNLDTGRYSIKASYMGYADFQTLRFNFTNKNEQVPDLVMQENSTGLNEVSITATRQIIERKADRLIFHVAASASAAGSPLLDVLKMVPGISVINDKLNIRGKEGLIVMIDSRRTYMTGDELLSYLKNTPAEAIAQLEVITNPSARYDAEGNVGIINIKTKHSTLTGATGTLSQTIGFGRYLKSTTGGQVTYTGSKLTLFGNSYLSYNKSFEDYTAEKSLNNSEQLLSKDHNIKNSRNNYAYQAGFDYRINARNSFGGVLDGSLRPDYQSQGLSKVEKTGTDPQYIQSFSPAKTSNTNNAANLHYYWNNDLNTDLFSADANYVNYNYDLHSSLINDYYASPQYDQGTLLNQEQLRNQSIREVEVLAGKADYTHKWASKHSFETGIKWSQVKTNSDLVYELLQASQWVNDPGKTNQYRFTEQIYAGYVNYNGQFGKFNLQTGLRAEQTTNTGFSKTLNTEVKGNYLKLFPSVFISSSFLKNHSWSASYSYRIDRPTYSYLNPFTFINNPYSYFRGNPYLKPQFTHSLEANYDFKKKLFVSLSYQRTIDMISEVTEIGNAADVIGGTRANLNRMDSYSLTINAPFQPFKGWDLNLYAGAFNNSIKDLQGFSNKQTTFTASLNTTVSLPAVFMLDANGSYQSAMSYGTILLDPIYSVNAGIKRSFLTKKLNLKLSISDIFNLQKVSYTSSYASISTYGLNTAENRVFRLTASYKFGRSKASKQRNTGVEEEQKRAGN